MISAKKQGKTIEWERLEISSRKLETSREDLCKVGTVKDRNGMEITKAKNIKKRWQEYTGELYKKDIHDPDNHLEPDILECKLKWT